MRVLVCLQRAHSSLATTLVSYEIGRTMNDKGLPAQDGMSIPMVKQRGTDRCIIHVSFKLD